MEAREVLLVRLDALHQQLVRAASALQSEAINPTLRKRVRARFDTLIEQQRGEVKRLREDVAKGTAATPWKSLVERRAESNKLFGECRAFVEGTLVRSTGMDQDVCRYADALLDQLSSEVSVHWSGVTIMGSATRFDRIAEIVRVGFPEFAIWYLPAVGHEFGHLVARNLKSLQVLSSDTDFQPLQELAEREGRGTSAEEDLQEHFADMFASWVHGPAYLCQAVVLRFDPANAYQRTARHPASAKRVEAMLRTLKAMQGADPLKPFDGIAGLVKQVWESSLAEAGQPVNIEAGLNDQLEIEAFDKLVEELLAILREDVVAAKYPGWPRAQEVWSSLREGAQAGVYPQATKATTIADVMNAAWLSRLTAGDPDAYDPVWVDEAARRMCNGIVSPQRLSRVHGRG